MQNYKYEAMCRLELALAEIKLRKDLREKINAQSYPCDRCGLHNDVKLVEASTHDYASEMWLCVSCR